MSKLNSSVPKKKNKKIIGHSELDKPQPSIIQLSKKISLR